MKMYFLDPCDWGQHWTVCAESPEEALRLIIEDLKDDEDNYHLFKNATVDNLPDTYVLKEFSLNHIIHGEYS